MKKSLNPAFYMIIILVFSLFACNGAFETEPEIPTGLIATGSGDDALDGSILLSWSPHKNSAVYFIYRGKDSVPQQTEEFLIGQTDSTGFRDSDADLSDDSVYYYKISAGSTYGKYESNLSAEAQGWLKKSLWTKYTIASTGDIDSFDGESDGQGGVNIVLVKSKVLYPAKVFFTTEANEDGEDEVTLDFQSGSLTAGTIASGSDSEAYSMVSNGTDFYIHLSDEDAGGGSGKINCIKCETEVDTEAEVTTVNFSLSFIGGNSGYSTNTVVSGLDSSVSGGFIYSTFIDNNITLEAYRFDVSGSGLLWESLPGGGPAVTVDATSRSFCNVSTGSIVTGALTDSDKIELYQLNSFQTDWDLIGSALPAAGTVSASVVTKDSAGRNIVIYHDGTSAEALRFEDGEWVDLSLSQSCNADSLLMDSYFPGGYFAFKDASGVTMLQLESETDDEDNTTYSWVKSGRNFDDATVKGLVTDLDCEKMRIVQSGGVVSVLVLDEGNLYLYRLE
jgi:hypothetical protein